MEQLYHNTGFKISKLITRSYSTSFSLGIAAFAPYYREAIYAIYAYVRLADEIVDSFHGYDKKKLLKEFRIDTFKALEEGISTNPILNSFQRVVKEYNIDHSYIIKFLDSMEMDLYNNYYEEKSYDEYIYGSAEVVGLMCLKVFSNNDDVLFNELIMPAKALGSAFQKVNFLRDMKSDLEERGRIYLPGIEKEIEINNKNKKMLEEKIDEEFETALTGIKKLPKGVRLGVYSAYMYYLMLFKKIKRVKVEKLLDKRVRISNLTKLALLIKSIVQIKILRIV